MIAECRDLGDEHCFWRHHLLASLANLVDSEFCCTGEMAGCRRLDLEDLGVVFWWRDRTLHPASVDAETDEILRDPNNWPAQSLYHASTRDEDGVCRTRRDLIDDRSWRSMTDHMLSVEVANIDHPMWCFRSMPKGGPDEHVGAIFYRVYGRTDFAQRDRAVVALAFELLAPMVGDELSRFADPSPMALSPRAREILKCMLEGDSDKQIALRTSLSRYTVNQYTKQIYRHFRTPGRTKLMARWLRRGWGTKCSWAD